MQLHQLQGQVRALDSQTRDLGGEALSVTTKIATLGREVEAGLPGSGNISSRIAAVHASLAAFQGEVASGHINTLIARRLRASFRRATASVDQLAQNVTERLQSGPQGAGANGTAAEDAEVAAPETTVADLLEPLKRMRHANRGYSPSIAGLVPEE